MVARSIAQSTLATSGMRAGHTRGMEHAYCTPEDLDAYASALGVDSHADDAPEAPGTRDAAVEQCIERASDEIDYYCQRYPTTELAKSSWIKSKCLTLACYYLAGRRFNTRPDSVQRDRDDAIEQLRAVLEGKARVPGAAQGKSAAPTVSHQRYHLNRYPSNLSERARETGRPEGYPRRVDPFGDYGRG